MLDEERGARRFARVPSIRAGCRQKAHRSSPGSRATRSCRPARLEHQRELQLREVPPFKDSRVRKAFSWLRSRGDHQEVCVRRRRAGPALSEQLSDGRPRHRAETDPEAGWDQAKDLLGKARFPGARIPTLKCTPRPRRTQNSCPTRSSWQQNLKDVGIETETCRWSGGRTSRWPLVTNMETGLHAATFFPDPTYTLAAEHSTTLHASKAIVTTIRRHSDKLLVTS